MLATLYTICTQSCAPSLATSSRSSLTSPSPSSSFDPSPSQNSYPSSTPLAPSAPSSPPPNATTPGLFLLFALQRSWELILIPILLKYISRHIPTRLILTSVALHDNSNNVISNVINNNVSLSPQIIAKFGLAVLDTVILTPLQVLGVRLAIQRREERGIMLTDSDEGDHVLPSDLARGSGKAPVVRLRTQTEQPAYTGLLDCLRSIVAEEGCDTLYRVWWFTFLTAIARVFV